jgi:hypothetical protein
MASMEQLQQRFLQSPITTSSNPSNYHVYVEDAQINDVTAFETYSDYVLGAAFFVTAAVALKRIRINRSSTSSSSSSTTASSSSSSSGAAESAVMVSFYSLILATALLRALYFVVPAAWWQPSYTPVAVAAWDKEIVTSSSSSSTTTTESSTTSSSSSSSSLWIGYALAEVTVTLGSLTLFSIFILILVYWADILKKYYNPDARRTLPMSTFLYLVLALAATEALNLALFLLGYYSTEGMILFNAIVLAVTSLVCVAQITLFSRKFQNVLKTLGAINQVSTDSQVRRIVWITVTGNLFFLTRAGLEGIFALYLTVYWWKHGTVARAFSHAWWDTYSIAKYASELVILALMLHILQSRFSSRSSTNASGSSSGMTASSTAGYTKVPDVSVDV